MAHSEGSFVRWQATAIAQLGYAVGLILSFAGASLGFALSVVKDKDYLPWVLLGEGIHANVRRFSLGLSWSRPLVCHQSIERFQKDRKYCPRPGGRTGLRRGTGATKSRNQETW